MRILIAIDSSRASQCVLEEAATRPWPANTLFTIVNVVDLYRFAHLPAIVDDARREATTLLREATDKLSRAGCKVNSEVLLGFPRNEIAEYAKKWQANLVMVGSHGQGAIARFLLGSVAQGVLRTAPCSVEIVRHNRVGAACFFSCHEDIARNRRIRFLHGRRKVDRGSPVACRKSNQGSQRRGTPRF